MTWWLIKLYIWEDDRMHEDRGLALALVMKRLVRKEHPSIGLLYHNTDPKWDTVT